MTRSWHAALRLRLRDSASYHPLGVPVLIAAVLIASGRWQPDWQERTPSPRLALAMSVWLATWLRRLVVAARRRESLPAA